MTDFKQEQLEELEAIESIYSEEIDIIDDSPHRFTIPVKTDDYDEDEDTGRFVLLKFTFTRKYPSEAPLVEFEESINIDDEHLDELLDHLKELIEENLGMQMIFTLVSGAIEWLGEKNDQIKNDIEEAAKKKKDIEDEDERKKLEGTKVTIESFLAWKVEFDAWRFENKLVKEKTGKEKLTGRELFMTDKSLNDSDIKFLANTGDVAISVDESLFEDMEDLDIAEEEEESDDPDWTPGEISD